MRKISETIDSLLRFSFMRIWDVVVISLAPCIFFLDAFNIFILQGRQGTSWNIWWGFHQFSLLFVDEMLDSFSFACINVGRISFRARQTSKVIKYFVVMCGDVVMLTLFAALMFGMIFLFFCCLGIQCYPKFAHLTEMSPSCDFIMWLHQLSWLLFPLLFFFASFCVKIDFLCMFTPSLSSR